MPRSLALLLALLCPLLACCAPQAGSVMRSSTEFRLQSLEAKYLELEEKQAALEVLATDRMQELREALATARGEIALLRSRLGEPVAAEPAPAPKRPAATRPKTAYKQKPEPPAPEAVQKPAPKAASPKPPAAEKPSPPATTATGSRLYEEALQRIQAGNPDQAIPLLERYVAENPTASLAPDARFWLGESHFFLGDYDKAILAYKDIAGRHPQHPKAPAAMLKIGYAYEKLQDPSNARFYLQALVDEYPGSEAASLAREKIAQLGM